VLSENATDAMHVEPTTACWPFTWHLPWQARGAVGFVGDGDGRRGSEEASG
jgi:hypothetical protein